MVKLSVCIPTFNRGPYIGHAIGSVVRQGDDDTEIVISDNASTDNTESVVRGWQQRYPRIVYHRHAVNQGADRNYLEVVQRASGEYCWFLGSDDALTEDSIALVRGYLRQAPTVIVTDRLNVSSDMSRPLFAEQVLNAAHGESFECRHPQELVRYLRSARTFTALFPYLSNLIFRRQGWLRHPPPERFIGSAYIHTVQLLTMLNGQGKLVYLHRPLALNRTDNDSFLAALGHSRRALIDLNYLDIADYVFASCPQVRDALRTVTRRFCFSWVPLMHRRLLCMRDDPESVAALEDGYRRAFAGGADYRVKMLAWHYLPARLLQFVYQHRGPFVALRRGWMSNSHRQANSFATTTDTGNKAA